MPDLIKYGFVYIACPPLYEVARRKRVEYVEDDAELNKILIRLGTEDVRLHDLASDTRDPRPRCSPRFSSCWNRSTSSRRRSAGMAAISRSICCIASPDTHELPRHVVVVRQGNEEVRPLLPKRRGVQSSIGAKPIRI